MRTIVVTAADAEPVVELARRWDAQTVTQDPPLGTGHAVLAAEGLLGNFDGNLLVLFGDTPLLTAATLSPLLEHLARGADVAALGFRPTIHRAMAAWSPTANACCASSNTRTRATTSAAHTRFASPACWRDAPN